MADFNTLSHSQILAELTDYGFTHIDDYNGSKYFQDQFNTILRLTIGTTTYAHVYSTIDETHWKHHHTLLSSATITDLNSLDILLVPQYSYVDPLLLNSNSLLNLNNHTVLTDDNRTYYQSDIFLDPTGIEYKVSTKPSPYRNRNVIWIPVVQINSNWVLEYNNSVQVNSNQVVSDVTYGDYIITIEN